MLVINHETGESRWEGDEAAAPKVEAPSIPEKLTRPKRKRAVAKTEATPAPEAVPTEPVEPILPEVRKVAPPKKKRAIGKSKIFEAEYGKPKDPGVTARSLEEVVDLVEQKLAPASPTTPHRPEESPVEPEKAPAPVSLRDVTVAQAERRIRNREDWLYAFLEEAKPHFDRRDFIVPTNIRIGVGFTSKGHGKTRKSPILGEAWAAEASEDGTHEIIITPEISEPVEVAATLVHEIAHCVVGLEAKHGRDFKACVVAMGLEGKPSATHAGENFLIWAEDIIRRLGDYPHHRLSGASSAPKKQKCRQLKGTCMCEEPLIVRASKEVALTGQITCSACGSAFKFEIPEDSEEGEGDEVEE